MKKYFDVLKNCPLFFDIEKENLFAMLTCMNATSKTFEKGQTIFAEGDKTSLFGILIDGEVQVSQTDFYGNKNIIANITPPHLFAETFACAKTNFLLVDVVATQKSTVLLVNINKVLSPCHNACSFHNKMIFNLMKTVASKNISLTQKIQAMSKRTTRDKLLSYLLTTSKEQNSKNFCIPFDRQELADYLGVDRSGLSNEISKLKADGIIDCHKNNFSILLTNDIHN